MNVFHDILSDVPAMNDWLCWLSVIPRAQLSGPSDAPHCWNFWFSGNVHALVYRRNFFCLVAAGRRGISWASWQIGSSLERVMQGSIPSGLGYFLKNLEICVRPSWCARWIFKRWIWLHFGKSHDSLKKSQPFSNLRAHKIYTRHTVSILVSA